MKGHNIKWSDAELSFIKKNRRLTLKSQYALFQEKFNRSDISEKAFHALRERKRWLTGRTGQFKKGNVPHPGAGLKGPNKTSFKKGHKPATIKPVGSTRIIGGVIQVKTHEPDVWQYKHWLVWEEAHGKIPDGHCIAFIDGDGQNTDINNLEMISRNELLQINRLGCHSNHPEIQTAIRTIGKLTAKIIDVRRAQND